MSVIKNIHLLAGSLSDQDFEKLEVGASMHKRHSRIEFKIVSFDADKELVVRAVQAKNPAKNYVNKHGLIVRAQDLFQHFYPNISVKVHAVPYVAPVVDVVDIPWIEKQMTAKSVRIKDIVEQTGLDKSIVSGWLTGARPMSQPVKAMFYFALSGQSFSNPTTSDIQVSISDNSPTRQLISKYFEERKSARKFVMLNVNDLRYKVTLENPSGKPHSIPPEDLADWLKEHQMKFELYIKKEDE